MSEVTHFSEQSHEEWQKHATAEAQIELERAVEDNVVHWEFLPSSSIDRAKLCNSLLGKVEFLLKYDSQTKQVRLMSGQDENLIHSQVEVFEFTYSKPPDKGGVDEDDHAIDVSGAAWRDGDSASIILTQTHTSEDGRVLAHMAAWLEIATLKGKENLFSTSSNFFGAGLDWSVIQEGNLGPYIHPDIGGPELRINNRDPYFFFAESSVIPKTFSTTEANEALTLLKYFSDAVREWEDIVVGDVEKEANEETELSMVTPAGQPKFN